MFKFLKQRTTKLVSGERRSKSTRERRLRFENLEGRAMLAGDVTVALVGTTLTLTGDASGNEVEITAGANVGEYAITGLNGTSIIGSTLINDPFDLISVDLAGGSDTFTVRGASPSSKLLIPGDISISNSDGNNTNKLINVQLNDDLTITKVAGTSESNVEITGTVIIGDTVLDAGGFHGDSKTVISGDSHLQGDLTIDNYDGEDHFVTYASTIDGDVDIDNRDGDTRTVFGITEDPVIWGSLTISNGVGNDKVFIHDTDVWQDVDIDNGDGHTLVSVEDSDFGLGAPVGTTGDFELDNGVGIDEFKWVDSTVRDDLNIDNGAPGDQFGSKTDINGARIGNDFFFDGDGGFDTFSMQNARIIDDSDFDFFDGGSLVYFFNVVFVEVFDFDGNAGNDEITFEQSTLESDAIFDLGSGRDLIELLQGTQLLGSTSMEGGADIDKLRRQVGPPADAIVIAFLAFENLELDEFVL